MPGSAFYLGFCSANYHTFRIADIGSIERSDSAGICSLMDIVSWYRVGQVDFGNNCISHSHRY